LVFPAYTLDNNRMMIVFGRVSWAITKILQSRLSFEVSDVRLLFVRICVAQSGTQRTGRIDEGENSKIRNWKWLIWILKKICSEISRGKTRSFLVTNCIFRKFWEHRLHSTYYQRP
jgi:hypothetical protein